MERRQAPIDRSHEGLWQGRACGRFALGTGRACGRFDLNVHEMTLAVHETHAQVEADDCGLINVARCVENGVEIRIPKHHKIH